MKIILLVLPLLLMGCTTARGGILKSIFTAQVADEVKVADKVTGIEKASIKSSVAAEASSQIGQTNEKTITGRDSNTSTYNDTKVVERYIGLMKTFLWTVGCISATIISALCGVIALLSRGLIWCLRYMLESERIEQEDQNR